MIPFKTSTFDPAARVFEVRDLTVCVNGSGRKVLDGVSLTIAAGETACLVGESGSGKSVTSLTTMGLLPKKSLSVTGGSLTLKGSDILSLSPKDQRDLRGSGVAMIFQEPMTALNPVMRVGEQIAEVLKTHGLPRAEIKARVRDVMEQVHLPDIDRMIDSFPHQLSGGQRQRVMIAMALVMEPALLIADEPTTALDVTTQKQILALISELQAKHGTAVLFITHDMGVVAEIADTVHVMRQGKIVEAAPAEQIFRAPGHDYTKALLEAVPSLIPRTPREVVAGEPVLKVSDLRKDYAKKTLFGQKSSKLAAQEVNFTLAKGRTLGIVGESGSGKSTVARCVMRLIDPTGGEIRVSGTDITHSGRSLLRRQRQKFQIVFQDPYRSLNPRRRVVDSLIEGPMNFGISREAAVQRAGELMELVGLTKDALNRFPHQFSGGQRQRIAIARAVAMEPDLIVADEAVSALDVSVQAQVLELLEDLQKRLGIAILFITHDLRVAAQICDEVLVMQNGRVVEQGSARDVLVAPKSSYTQSLIEAAPGRGWDFAAGREIRA